MVSASRTTRPLMCVVVLLLDELRRQATPSELTFTISRSCSPLPISLLPRLSASPARPTCLPPLWSPQDDPRPNPEPTVRIGLPSCHLCVPVDPARRGRALPHRRNREHEHGSLHPSRDKVSPIILLPITTRTTDALIRGGCVQRWGVKYGVGGELKDSLAESLIDQNPTGEVTPMGSQ